MRSDVLKFRTLTHSHTYTDTHTYEITIKHQADKLWGRTNKQTKHITSDSLRLADRKQDRRTYRRDCQLYVRHTWLEIYLDGYVWYVCVCTEVIWPQKTRCFWVNRREKVVATLPLFLSIWARPKVTGWKSFCQRERDMKIAALMKNVKS